MKTWQSDLIEAARDSRAKFESVEHVGNEAHARVLIALLRAFGDDPATTILAEPRTPDRSPQQNARPTDVLILHPSLGCFLVEVKGWVIEEITGIEAGTIFRRTGGREEAKNPWNQAQEAAGQLQAATRRVLKRRSLSEKEMPYFDWVVSLPSISRSSWVKRGYGHSISNCEVLLADDLLDADVLRTRLLGYIKAKASHRIPFSREQLDSVREALGSSYIISNRNRREKLGQHDTLGKTIDSHEIKDKRLSAKQIELIEAEFDGRPQLIRGVAGSGKSVVLVRNCVNLVNRYVNSDQVPLAFGERTKRFAIICYNRSLVPYLRSGFEDAFRELVYREAPDCIDIFHLNGLQHHLSTLCGGPLTYQRYADYKHRHEATCIPSQIAAEYSKQLDHLAISHKELFESLQYDAIYVDEGQDLFDEEFLFLMRLLRTNPETGDKNIVISYDDAQNLYGRPRPAWNKLGIQVTGRSSVMDTCYRNSKQIIEFAFNVLLGVRAETRAMTRTFADLSTLKSKGLVAELPDRWQVNFADRSDGTKPEVKLFDVRDQEIEWIIDRIRQLIETEDVRPEDVLILFKEPKEFAAVPSKLRDLIPGVRGVIEPYGSSINPSKDRYIFEEGSLTITTVQSAKGYDCPVVFVIGADLFPTDTEGRASFYVAASRSKMHLFVTGLHGSGNLAEEACAVASLLDTPASDSALASKHVSHTDSQETQLMDDGVLRLYRRGEVVKHPSYGVGVVLEDAIPKLLPSQRRRCQSVKVQFKPGVKQLVAELAGLELLQSSDTQTI